MPKANKGGQYEREVCKQLGLWWTHGERDDVFWRSAQSGGRATTRAKQGKRTHGSYGDIAAVDPIGEPLIKFATIELKRGNTHGSAADLLEVRPTRKQRPFERCINQTINSAQQARSVGWFLIVRRDQRIPLIYMPVKLYGIFNDGGATFMPRFVFKMMINQTDNKDPKRLQFVAVHFDDFLKKIDPNQIIEYIEQQTQNTSK